MSVFSALDVSQSWRLLTRFVFVLMVVLVVVLVCAAGHASQNPAPDHFLGLAARATAHEAAGNTKAAIDTYRRALACVPEAEQERLAFAEALARSGWAGSLPPRQALARYVFRLAQCLHRVLWDAGRIQEALAVYDELAVRYPTYRLLHLARIDGLRRAGELERALEAAREAARNIRGYPSISVALATTLRGAGQAEEAEQVLRETIAAFPGRPAAYTELGLLLLAAGEYEEAEQVLRQAVELRKANNDPGPATRIARIKVLTALGRCGEARESAVRCERLGVALPVEVLASLQLSCADAGEGGEN